MDSILDDLLIMPARAVKPNLAMTSMHILAPNMRSLRELKVNVPSSTHNRMKIVK